MTKVCPTCSTTFPDSKAFCPEDGTTLRATEVHGSLIGNVVADRYLVTDLLGEGGMGKVYLARHVRLPRQAAIKILHRSMVSDPDAVVRFNREAANASRIVHERVATVWDFGETHDGLVYLAMEYVPGQTLKALLADAGPLGAERTARLIGQIADGLDAAHRLKIVHRDLKPDNILVWQDDAGDDECKIVDFGIAKAVGVDGDEHALTKTGFVVGTPEYMSPEQIRGDTVDVRSDVYALALVAYRCLTGEAAFDTNTPDRGMMARLSGAPRPLRELLPGGRFSSDVQGVLLQALAIDPAARFASAGVLATALARALFTQSATGEPTRTVATPQRSQGAVPPDSGRSIERTPVAVPSMQAPVAPAAAPHPPVAPSSPQAPAVTRAPRRRRGFRLPRIPVFRWATTAAVLGFGWLVLTEGSLNRAIRRATGLAREAETSGKRLMDQAVDQAAATVRSAAGAGGGGASGAAPANRTPSSKPASADALSSATAPVDIAAQGKPVTDSASTVPSANAAGTSAAVAVDVAVSARLRSSAAALAAGDSVAACSVLEEARGLASTAADSTAVRQAAARTGCGED